VRACYLHACLKYVNREHLTNTSVRGRFGIEQQNIATASRLIKEAVTPVSSRLSIPTRPRATAATCHGGRSRRGWMTR